LGWYGAAEAMLGASMARPANARMLERMSCLVFMGFFLSKDIEEMRRSTGALEKRSEFTFG
jgi:hypothetical protein